MRGCTASWHLQVYLYLGCKNAAGSQHTQNCQLLYPNKAKPEEDGDQYGHGDKYRVVIDQVVLGEVDEEASEWLIQS